jgi:hypothetical protein
MTRRVTKQLTMIAAATAAATCSALLLTSTASGSDGLLLTDAGSANTRSDGYAPTDVLSPQLRTSVVAQGSTKVENPGALTSTYGYDNDVLNSSGDPQMLPTPTTSDEAQKTEPDKNVYLVFPKSLPGADPHYYYGTHFLFQGHEGGADGAGYITRVNLDADAAHRVTVLATKDRAGDSLATIDGIAWDPWAKRLLLTTEDSSAPTYAATPGYPSEVEDISGALGRGGYEGIQDDSAGDIWIVEDAGGDVKLDQAGTKTTAKRPNSFLYRYVPVRRGDLADGRLQVLRVSAPDGHPITFASQAGLNNPDQVLLHTYGHSLKTTWVTIHDTAADGTTPFDANTLAKAADATPFKRPENGQFQPETRFGTFFFDETGDTNATSPENGAAGGWGAIQRLVQKHPNAATGTLSLFYQSDAQHASFDNCTFLTADAITFVQDMGDTLHGQINALDSGFVFDVGTDYSTGVHPLRWLAEGRDASATIDAANDGFGKNDGDNEITGVHVSDGAIGPHGLLGAETPELFRGKGGWHWFYTGQHGDNRTYEVLSALH